MMPKQKHQQPPDASPTMITHLKRDSCDSPDQPHAEEPPAKRQRGVPLNFSIESIMQPHLQQQHQQATDKSGRQQFESRSPTPSSSMSPVSTRHADHERSASSSPASLVSAGSVELKCDRLSPGASSISRASTPISPGCCDNPRKPAGHDQHHHHHHDQHNSTSQTAAYMSNSVSKQPESRINSQTQAVSQHNRSNQQQQQPSASKGGSHASNLLANMCNSPRLNNVKCMLDNKDMWDRFHSLDTEMIITKQGRRMFPPVRVTFSLDEMAGCSGTAGAAQLQLNGRDKYHVLMDILPYDKKRYRYAYHRSSWQQAGKADPASPPKLFLHPDGPFTLDQLKRQSVISFEKIKLTNNDANKHGYIVLNSMHKYQPRIHLVLWRGKESQNLANGPISLLDNEPHKTFVFSETIFTAVTAYQNHSITKLKIDSNPFAKGFRDHTRLTDMELESMQDLVDGQCPFSPPRAPPPGFPHFLFGNPGIPQPFGLPPPPPPPHTQSGPPHSHHPFLAHPALPVSSGGASMQQAAGHPQLGVADEAAAALWRERTIMALDSLFQQQQQQQQHQGNCEMAQSLQGQLASQAARLAAESPGGGTGPQQHQHQTAQAPLPAPPPPAPVSQPANGPLELQFLMQEQQKFAAAMAAAAAAAAQQHHLPHPLQHLFAAQPQLQRSPQLPDVKTSATPTSQSQQQQPMLGQQPQAPTSATQTSPIGAAKTAARNQMQQAMPTQPTYAEGLNTHNAFQAHQLQALMLQHQQQMAALSAMQQQQQRPQGTHPALVLANGRSPGAVRDKHQSASEFEPGR